MSYKILEEIGIVNENVDGAMFNNFLSHGKSGIIGGVLNNCKITPYGVNAIKIDTGELLIKGFRIKFTEPEIVSIPSPAIKSNVYIVLRITLNSDRSLSHQLLYTMTPTYNEVNFYKTESGTYDYPLAIVSAQAGTDPVIVAGPGIIDFNDSSAKLYRHTIKAWANYRDQTPGGEIDGSDPLFSSLTLVVYRTTETPLTITDISNEEMRTASIKDFQKWDAPDMYRAPLFAEKNDTSIKIYFVNGFTTDSSGNLNLLSTDSVTSTKFNFTDTVTEV